MLICDVASHNSGNANHGAIRTNLFTGIWSHSLTLFSNSRHSHHAPGNASFRAIRKQQVGVARCTQRRGADVLCCNPGREQLAAIGFDEVEKYLFRQFAVARRSRCQKKQRVFLADGVRFLDFAEKSSSIFELRFELSPHFWADGVAATMNSGAYRGPEIAG